MYIHFFCQVDSIKYHHLDDILSNRRTAARAKALNYIGDVAVQMTQRWHAGSPLGPPRRK